MSPFVRFTILRASLFVLPLATMILLGLDPLLAVIIAAVGSTVAAAVLLRRQRQEMGEQIQRRAEERVRRANRRG